MGFSEKQVNALRRSLGEGYIRTREVQGRTWSYIEGWHAIAEANRIFGFDGWDRETVESKCVIGRDTRGAYHAVYLARVRITVRAEGRTVVREGFGSGEAQGSGAGETHERALKTAETDATKRALATFGKPFGLSLYVTPRNGRDHGVSNPLLGAPPIAERDRRRTQQRVGHNGRYFVPRRGKIVLDPTVPPHDRRGSNSELPPAQVEVPFSEQPAVANRVPLDPSEVAASEKPAGSTVDVHPSNEGAPEEQTSTEVVSPPLQSPADGRQERKTDSIETQSPPLAALPAVPEADEPRLLIEWPKRRRDPEHLRFVRTQPCLVCSRTPSDAHHLKFTQPRGLKVSDEFTVPLCRVHHDQLHRSGKEIDWWSAMDRDVDPLEIAKSLWEESRRKLAVDEPLTVEVNGNTPARR